MLHYLRLLLAKLDCPAPVFKAKVIPPQISRENSLKMDFITVIAISFKINLQIKNHWHSHLITKYLSIFTKLLSISFLNVHYNFIQPTWYDYSGNWIRVTYCHIHMRYVNYFFFSFQHTSRFVSSILIGIVRILIRSL